jgi:hypothetical protein
MVFGAVSGATAPGVFVSVAEVCRPMAPALSRRVRNLGWGWRVMLAELAPRLSMLRTIFGIGAIALLGLFALKVFFGLFGVLFALFFVLLGWALRIAIVGGLIYLVLRLLMPDTAKSIEEKFK